MSDKKIAAIRANEVIILVKDQWTVIAAATTKLRDWCVEHVGQEGSHPIRSVWVRHTPFDEPEIKDWALRMVTPDITDQYARYAFWFKRSEDAVHFALRWKGET